jgi:hypothetical protein
MPTTVVVSAVYPVSPDEAAALLRDPSWLEERHGAIGELDIRVVVEPVGDGFRVVLTRRKEMELPAVAKKVFGGSSQLRDDIIWRRDGDGWIYDQRVTIEGSPAEIAGRATVKREGSGCRHEVRLEVSVKMPVVGGAVERFVAEKVEGGLRAGMERNLARLRA